jgi:hypothetical protein
MSHSKNKPNCPQTKSGYHSAIFGDVKFGQQSAPAAFTHGSKALFIESSGIRARDRKYIKKRYDFANCAAPYIFGTCLNFRQKG